ncbi:MAG: AraC family transcriptional regulator [Lachnospiraceae bacterium]|nr:AraC family transcriptional regulator [Lachnospiraceae bacterium]
MEWTSVLNRTLALVEKNLTGELSASAIASLAAKEVFISEYYLQKCFQMMTGYPLGEYIRSRRLTEAGKELASESGKIIDIALKYGYETPESFTKAFSRFHGCTPSEAKRHPEKLRRFLPLTVSVQMTGGDKMDYTVSPMWGMKLIGFERTFSYEEGYREIPKFWDEICEKYCNHTIYAGLAPSCPEEQAIIDNCIGEYGVCIDDIGGGKFRYLIAGRYCGGEVPEGMALVELPQGEWAKFKAIGPIPEALQALNTRVFREWLPSNPDYEIAGGYNIEWYSCDGNQTDPDYESGIWVPVERK